ncbi:MAG TPA: redoxin domain-containing protein [Gammaproteobacteria bacterium]|nr:redoxin domain-containing protein [Gammaproteobacteria bacterium]
MKRGLAVIVIIVVALVAAGALAYATIPVVRYYLMPIAGATPAPKSLLGSSNKEKTAGPAVNAEKRLFANRKQLVPTIQQVPAEGGWINSGPLNLQQLEKQGKVILIDFWTYSCINCIRANPFDEIYWQRYKDHGLVIIGVASPEFQFEGVPENVLIGVKREGLSYPILMDAHMQVWRNFGNHFWPGKYLVNPAGEIVYHKFGEGDYEHEEQVIRHQLELAGHKDLPPDEPLDPKLDLIPSGQPQTGELYAGPGFLRQSLGNSTQPETGKTLTFHMPAQLGEDEIYLDGRWKGTHDYVESVGAGKIGLNYLAQAPYVVMDTGGGAKRIEVTLDGKPVPPQFRGTDIEFKNGKTWMTVNEPRLYWPIANRAPYGRHTIRFIVPDGVRLYSFTFGTYQLPNAPTH